MYFIGKRGGDSVMRLLNDKFKKRNLCQEILL
jgi:hypothetical protein